MHHRPQVVERASAFADYDLAAAEKARDARRVARVLAEDHLCKSTNDDAVVSNCALHTHDRRVIPGQQVAQARRVALYVGQRRATLRDADVHADGAPIAVGRRPLVGRRASIPASTRC